MKLASDPSGFIEVSYLKAMKKIKVHYAPVNLEGDIPVKEFDLSVLGRIKFTDLITDEISLSKDVVWVISSNEEVFVTDSVYSFQVFISNYRDLYDINKDENVFIQEYRSYKEAYKVALAMKEPNVLCYD